MFRTMALKRRCDRCSCRVELGFAPWTGSGPAVSAEWTCPKCGKENLVPAIGEVNWVDLLRGAPDDRSGRSGGLPRVH